MRESKCSEVFKETSNGMVSMQEVDAIVKVSPIYKFNDDKANGILAIALNFDDDVRADELVDNLNGICVERGEEPCWYLGDAEEEYVFVN